MRRALALLCLALVLAACYAPFDWREVRSTEGGFSALLPAKPARESREVAIGAHKLRMELISARVEQASFGVGYADLPVGMDTAGRVQLLADARDGFARSLGGQARDERIVSLDGHLGREFRVEGTRDGRTLVLAARVYATDRRFFQLVAVMPKNIVGKVDMPMFLESLKLAK